MLPDLPRSRLYGLAAAAAVLGLLGGALLAGDGDIDAPQGDIGWQLPGEDALARVSPDDAAALKAQAAWREAAGTSEARREARRVRWRLAGVVSDEGGTALVIAGRELTRVRPGDSLPDGSNLLEVRSDRIVYQDQDCRRTLMLFADPKAASTPECDTPGDSAD